MQERQGEICCYRPSLGSSFFPGQSSGLALEATKASRDPPSVSPKGLAQEVTAAHAEPSRRTLLRACGEGGHGRGWGPREAGCCRPRPSSGSAGLFVQAAARPQPRSCQQSGARARKNCPFQGAGVLHGPPCWPAQPREPSTSASANHRVSWVPEALPCPPQAEASVPTGPPCSPGPSRARLAPAFSAAAGELEEPRTLGHNQEGAGGNRVTRGCWREGSRSPGTDPHSHTCTCAHTHHATRVHTHGACSHAFTRACTCVCAALPLIPRPLPRHPSDAAEGMDGGAHCPAASHTELGRGPSPPPSAAPPWWPAPETFPVTRVRWPC